MTRSDLDDDDHQTSLIHPVSRLTARLMDSGGECRGAQLRGASEASGPRCSCRVFLELPNCWQVQWEYWNGPVWAHVDPNVARVTPISHLNLLVLFNSCFC